MSNFLHALAAVLVGNALYFVLMSHLPAYAQHVPFRTDRGLAVDAAFCLAALAAIKLLSRWIR